MYKIDNELCACTILLQNGRATLVRVAALRPWRLTLSIVADLTGGCDEDVLSTTSVKQRQMMGGRRE